MKNFNKSTVAAYIAIAAISFGATQAGAVPLIAGNTLGGSSVEGGMTDANGMLNPVGYKVEGSVISCGTGTIGDMPETLKLCKEAAIATSKLDPTTCFELVFYSGTPPKPKNAGFFKAGEEYTDRECKVQKKTQPGSGNIGDGVTVGW